MNKGKLIILEGPMGSGKSTQAKILFEKLKAARLSVKIFEYPDIANNLISRSINRMINNPDYDLTEATKVLLDSINSSQTMKTINQCLNDGVYVICEGSYISTIVKYCYLNNIDHYEDIINIMVFANMGISPDLIIVFDAPPKILIDRNSASNVDYQITIEDLEKIRSGYLLEAKNNNLPIIFTTDSADQISELVWEKVTKCLAVRAVATSATESSMPTALSEILDYRTALLGGEQTNYFEKNNLENENSDHIISESEYLKNIVTNMDQNIYAINNSISASSISAAIAKSETNGESIRQNLLTDQNDDISSVQKKIISAELKNSNKSFSNFNIAIEGISSLLVKNIKNDCSTKILVHPLNRLEFNHLKINEKYNYFTPNELDAVTKKAYRQSMNQIFELYSDIVDKLIEYLTKKSKTATKSRNSAWKRMIKIKAYEAASGVLPVALKSSVLINCSAQAIENLVGLLMSDRLLESRASAKKILDNINLLDPNLFEKTDILTDGYSQVAYRVETENEFKQFSDKNIKNGFSSDLEKVNLVDYYPKNEINLLPYMFSETTGLSLAELKSELNKWPYREKVDAFSRYIGNRYNPNNIPGKALEIGRYSWEVLCDSICVDKLQNFHTFDNSIWQELTPRYGFDIPEIIEKAGLTDYYQQCFDLSLKLYILLKLKKYDSQAQYATLLGHKIRYLFTTNSREIFNILESVTESQPSLSYQQIIVEMYQKLAEVHPSLSSLISFFEKRVTPEIEKLSLERNKRLKQKKII